MNKNRRKALADVQVKIEELKGILESLKEAEEEYRDNMPENLWGSERYEKAETACDELDNAVDSLDDAISSIEEAIS